MDTTGAQNLATAAATVTTAAAIVESIAAQQQQLLQSKQSGSALVTAEPNSSRVGSAVKRNSQQTQGDTGVASSVVTVPAKDVPATPIANSRIPRDVSLLESYKQSWKAANNHFQRYTDVKQREERRPTIVDIANQSHVLQIGRSTISVHKLRICAN